VESLLLLKFWVKVNFSLPKKQYDKYHLITGFGKGIDCRKLGEVRRESHWWGSYTRRLDEYNYLKKATAQLGYNYSKHRWYIQTSFPVR